MRDHSHWRWSEAFEEMRQRMIDDAVEFIDWGLEHPEQVERIPTHRVGEGEFPERARRLFYAWLLEERP
jgi:hypothetical protein